MKQKKLYLNRWQLFWSGACRADRRKFKRLFGWKAELTDANMRIAMEHNLNVVYFLKYCRASRPVKARLMQLWTNYLKEWKKNG